jgi:hypothetical protein
MAMNHRWRRWLRACNNLVRSQSQRRGRAARVRPSWARPWLEGLEDRVAPATVQFGLAHETLLQTAGTFTIPVELSVASKTNTLVPFTLSGTAVAGTDYSGLSASPLVIGAGQLAASITGTLLTPSDGTRTLTLNLGTPTGAGLGSTTANTLTIDDQPASFTTVSISNASTIDPGPGNTVNMNFTVTRTGDLSLPLAVSYTTVAGTAQPGTDFAPTTGIVTFAANAPTATIAIPIFGDGIYHSPT